MTPPRVDVTDSRVDTKELFKITRKLRASDRDKQKSEKNLRAS